MATDAQDVQVRSPRGLRLSHAGRDGTRDEWVTLRSEPAGSHGRRGTRPRPASSRARSSGVAESGSVSATGAAEFASGEDAVDEPRGVGELGDRRPADDETPQPDIVGVEVSDGERGGVRGSLGHKFEVVRGVTAQDRTTHGMPDASPLRSRRRSLSAACPSWSKMFLQ